MLRILRQLFSLGFAAAFTSISLLFSLPAAAQKSLKTIPLPTAISSVNEEFSGMSWSGNRLYLLPQYGNHKETLLKWRIFYLQSLADSIARVIDQKDTALTQYKIIKVKKPRQASRFC